MSTQPKNNQPEPDQSGSPDDSGTTSQKKQKPKRKTKHVSQAEQLLRYGTAISLALTDETLEGPLAEYGYDKERLREGEAVFNRAQELYTLQTRALDKRKISVYQFNEAWKEAKTTYSDLLTIARMAFKNDTSSWEQLNLGGRRGRSFSKWLQNANNFYSNILSTPEILKAFKHYNIPPKKIRDGFSLVEKTEKADAHREKMKAEAKEAAEQRDQAFVEMRHWMSDLINVAKLALGKTSQLLEKFGVVVR